MKVQRVCHRLISWVSCLSGQCPSVRLLVLGDTRCQKSELQVEHTEIYSGPKSVVFLSDYLVEVMTGGQGSGVRGSVNYYHTVVILSPLPCFYFSGKKAFK